MSYSNKLKQQIDLPVYEWMRFYPAAAPTIAAFECDYNNTFVGGTGRYAYHVTGTTLYRYDTLTDSWNQLANCPATTALTASLVYNPSQGYYGKAIGPGGGTNTIQMAALIGPVMNGYKIYIYAGTGAGQERTITGIANPVIHDQGPVTAAGASSMTDGTTGVGVKTWKWNQWRDYQVRFTYGTGQNQVRRILYNSYQVLYFIDTNYSALHSWHSPTLQAALGATNATFYQIESSIVTVNTNWAIPPDNTSRFVIKSGGLWFATGIASDSYYRLSYYDILADTWYVKSTQTGLQIATLSTLDWTIECLGEEEGGTTTNGAWGTPLATNVGGGTISVASAPYNTRTLIDSLQTMATNKYANMVIRLTGGTGAGQSRHIIANNSTTFILGRDWDVIPDNTTTYQVLGDSDKIYMAGGGNSAIFEYSVEDDMMTAGVQHDFGVARAFSAALAPNGIGTVSVTPAGTGTYVVGNILTLTTNGTATGSGGTVQVLTVNSSNQVTAVQVLTAGTNYPSSVTPYATTGGGGSGCTITVVGNTVPGQVGLGIVSIAAGTVNKTIASVSVGTTNSGGTNYNVGDLVAVTGFTSSLLRVTSITQATGAVLGLAIETPGVAGAGVVANNIATTNGTVKNSLATGLTVNVLTVTTAATATTAINHNFTIGDVITVSGDNSTGTYYNGTFTVLGVPSLTTFIYGSVNASIAANAAALAAQSTTVLADCTKNWQANELIGKIVMVTPGGTGQTAQARRIIANTATSMTFALALSGAATNGTTKYVIHDPKALGTECTNKNKPTRYGWGMATGSQSTTTIQDTSKVWVDNEWQGKKVKIMAGTGVNALPNEFFISSNNSNTLTVNGGTGFVMGFTPDATTVYSIMDNWGLAVSSTTASTGGLLTVAVGSTPGTGYAVGDLLYVLAAANQGIVRVTSVSSGGVTGVIIIQAGSGYTSAATNQATVKITGSGDNTFTINTSTVTAVSSLTTLLQMVSNASEQSGDNWGVNALSTKRVRWLTGSASQMGQEVAIATNTANVLTTGTVTANANASSSDTMYAIYGASYKTSGMSLLRIFGNSVGDKARYLVSWRGGATPTIEQYDIVNNIWDFLTQTPMSETFTIGSMFEYNGKDRIYFTKDVTGRVAYYDLAKNIIVPCSTVPYGMGGTGYQGNRMFTMNTPDLVGTTLEYLYVMRTGGQEVWRVLIFW